MRPTAQDVRGAAQRLIRDMHSDLDSFALTLFPDGVEESYGGWLLPAESRGSSVVRKSYELHKFIESIENRLLETVNATVTIDLQHTPHKNGH